jgi:hypothetical protein
VVTDCRLTRLSAVTFGRNVSFLRPSYTLYYNGSCPFTLTGLDCADVRPQLQHNIDMALGTPFAGKIQMLIERFDCKERYLM